MANDKDKVKATLGRATVRVKDAKLVTIKEGDQEKSHWVASGLVHFPLLEGDVRIGQLTFAFDGVTEKEQAVNQATERLRATLALI